MTRRIARFERVSRERFFEDSRNAEAYDQITLPKRATSGSAGYDFYAPYAFTLAAGESAVVATGVRVRIDEGWVLMLYPRSGLGFKYRLALDNTVGVIDSDYYLAENEGHILIKLTNHSPKGETLHVAAGDRFAQGVFCPFGITEDDSAEATRTGGFGSSG